MDNQSLVIASGGSPYLEAFPHISAPYMVILGAASVLGTAGNLAVIASIALVHNLHKPQSVFLLSLAVADLVVTALMDPLSILGQCHTYSALGQCHTHSILGQCHTHSLLGQCKKYSIPGQCLTHFIRPMSYT